MALQMLLANKRVRSHGGDPSPLSSSLTKLCVKRQEESYNLGDSHTMKFTVQDIFKGFSPQGATLEICSGNIQVSIRLEKIIV